TVQLTGVRLPPTVATMAIVSPAGISVTPLTGGFAARVDGIDVRTADRTALNDLRGLVHHHGVVIVPGQVLDPAAQVALTAQLGEVFSTPYTRQFEEHPGVLALR